ncbi:MAG TPA: CvpA family protein [Candidatus Udaeobacter sp.]|nr:CvpA family protein [Candidatus Udaeobacter sp.]
MTSEAQEVAGSPLWQVVFISFAVILILFEVVRGWRLGLMRQITRLVALGAAYAAALLGAGLFVPVARSFFKMPDPVLSILCGAILAFAVYALVSGIGAILFKRTTQQESGLVRLIYGIAGAIVGLFFGLFLLWLTVSSVRAIGALAEGQATNRASARPHDERDATSHALNVRRRFLSESDERMPALATSLARLKNSLELGPLGSVLKNTDPISQRTYKTLEKAGSVLSSPERTQKFLTFPGARELAEHPKVVALRSDPEIADLIAKGRFMDLLQNPRVIEVVNDPVLAERIKKFDIQRALDYALERESVKR